MHTCHLVMDFQYGSTGKGLLAGYLAKRGDYDTAVCSFATNAGHTYIDQRSDIHVMTQQLPTAGVISKTVKTILLGPGSLIHWETLRGEVLRYVHLLEGKRLLIHPHAAVVEDYHSESEMLHGMTKMGSTSKGVGEAMIERIRRGPAPNTAIARHPEWIQDSVCTVEEYRAAIEQSENMIVEGAQGFSLSIYHGIYPYTTSRDVTPWQIAADCGLPFKVASTIQIFGTLRTYPIRVNNRDGFSGPGFDDQEEISWEKIGVTPELTTVTKLPRRIFTFSQKQLEAALWHCGHYWKTSLFLNFANYMKTQELTQLMKKIESVAKIDGIVTFNRPKIEFLGFGPDDSEVATRAEFEGEQDGY